MPKPFSEKNSSGTIKPIAGGLQMRILPSQYLWKILSLHIQEQVVVSHTGSRKKT